MPYFFIRFLEKTLLPSMIAAFARGPKAGMPMASNASTAPSTSGSSGATTAKSIAFSFANAVMPAMSFARIAPNNTATIHNSYDSIAVMSGEQMEQDVQFVIDFTDRMVNAKRCPIAREMPDNMKAKLDEYLLRKRPAEK